MRTQESLFQTELEEGVKDEHVEKHWLVDSSPVQIAVSLAVVLNTMAMGLEADHPEWEDFWVVSENVFLATFAVEMAIKLYFLRLGYFLDKGNWLDGGLVMVGLLTSLLLKNLGNMDSLSLLRIVRLFRLVRMLRLFRQFKRFTLILKAVVDALATTVWVGALVMALVYVCSIFCTEMLGRPDESLYPGFTTDVALIDDLEFVQEFNPHVMFGSMSRSMLTLLNIVMMAEWTEVVRPIAMKQPVFLIFFLLFTLFVTYGVMNVIIGMIVDNVMQNAVEMQKLSESAEVQRKLEQLEKIQHLVFSIDSNGDGSVSSAEMTEAVKQSNLKHLLQKVNMPPFLTGEELLSMLDDDGDGQLLYEEIVKSLYRLIDSDTFQRSCFFQMGINKVKQGVHHCSQVSEATQEVVRSLETVLLQLRRDVRRLSTSGTSSACVPDPPVVTSRVAHHDSSFESNASSGIAAPNPSIAEYSMETLHGDAAKSNTKGTNRAMVAKRLWNSFGGSTNEVAATLDDDEPEHLPARLAQHSETSSTHDAEVTPVLTLIDVLELRIADALEQAQGQSEASRQSIANACATRFRQEVLHQADDMKGHIQRSVEETIGKFFTHDPAGPELQRKASSQRRDKARDASFSEKTEHSHTEMNANETPLAAAVEFPPKADAQRGGACEAGSRSEPEVLRSTAPPPAPRFEL